ncbi:MAG TPA: fumarylacetoacetate hydrolase family protein [Steroidobacteraceae bacterium]
MKLLRYSVNGKPTLGVVKNDSIVDLSPLGFPSMLALMESGTAGLTKVGELLAKASPQLSLQQAKLLAPIEKPGKYLAIGMNYRKHAEEARRLGVTVPEKQLWFNKQTSCLAGPYDDIHPGVTEKLDYEVELGVVIGPRAAKSVTEADARKFVYGYFVANDVSARDWQMHTPTFTVGKSFDTHGPIGPWIVTADEIADPHKLALRCFVNGQLRQQSNTSELIFNIWQQIAYLSTAFTLEPGDLLATGTPEGVGVGMSPPQFMKPGDVVRCEVDGIGAIENKVVN